MYYENVPGNNSQAQSETKNPSVPVMGNLIRHFFCPRDSRGCPLPLQSPREHRRSDIHSELLFIPARCIITMCLAKTLTPSKRTEFRRLRHPMTSLSPAAGNQSRPFFARCSGSFELHEALRYTIKDKTTR